jgi:N-acetylneuraminate synthase
MNSIFNNLFILELANNHWGSVSRGKKIIKEFSKIVKDNNVKASIKLQFRDVDSFIHKNFRTKKDKNPNLSTKKLRYIEKTSQTKLSSEEFSELVSYIRDNGCIPMATAFDELSVDLCAKFDMPIIKVASSDLNDWTLLQKIASIKKPTILSTGGANEKQIDDSVKFFLNREISIALNHCVSKYPSENDELELDQIDYLKNRYPNITIGLSTHEYTDWYSSMLISYGKGARTWERHIDIPYPKNHVQKEVSPYCSLPHQIDEWFKAFNIAQAMCGKSSDERRTIDQEEIEYLEALYRGLYLKKNVKKGDTITINHLYSAIPYQKEIGQLSSRNFIGKDCIAKHSIKKDNPLTKNDIE